MEGKIQKRPNKGLNTNGNLISEDGNIMSIGEIQIIIQVTCNFLLYISINFFFKTAEYIYLKQTDVSTSLCIAYS